MTSFAAVALYPLFATTSLVAITALRFGSRLGRGLLAVSVMLSVWVACLIALEHPGSAVLAERYLPLGIMMAGPFVHAGADLIPLRRAYLLLAYGFGASVALIGTLFPQAYFTPGFASPGPLFWPVAVLSAIGVVWSSSWMLLAALDTQGRLRRRRFALGVGSVFASLGTGGATASHIFGISSLGWAAPPLLVAIALVSYAIVSGEVGRLGLLLQGFVYTVMTATLGAFGVVGYYEVLPLLAPGTSILWLLLITFLVALPLDQLRGLMVESVGRALFAAPIGVRDLAEQVRKSETRAEHAEGLAEIGTMASAVAHELRNPLGVIRAQAALLERRGADKKSVFRLREQVDRASVFIDDLLRYSRPRPLTTALIQVSRAMGALISDVQEIHGGQCPGIELVCEGHDTEVEADSAAFTDVHTTLLLNAIAAGASSIRVEIGEDSKDLVVVVRDDGSGVPEEIRDSLFEPFVTGRGRDTAFPGTGLGLAIARRWVQRHGGSIVHKAEPPHGALFEVRWPKRLVNPT